MNPLIIGELFGSRFDDGSFNFRDNSLIFYSNYEQVMAVVGADISVIQQEIEQIVGGNS